MPSVESIATARTRSSPRCCWTSAIEVDRRAAVPLGERDPERAVDRGQAVGEDGVDHDALDLDDPADVLSTVLCVRHASPEDGERMSRRRREGRLPARVSLPRRPRRSARHERRRASLAATRAAWSRLQTYEVTSDGIHRWQRVRAGRRSLPSVHDRSRRRYERCGRRSSAASTSSPAHERRCSGRASSGDETSGAGVHGRNAG